MTTDVITEPVAADDLEPPTGADGRREYYRACVKGGLLAAIPFIGVLLLNGVNMLSDSFTTRFYPSQARSLLQGHWDMPKVILEYEGFQHGAYWYMYYGPFPALLRMPFVHLIPGVAERMTQTMILAAMALALVCTARIGWNVRELVRPGQPVTRRDRRWAAAMVLVVGAGSAFLFLASQAWIYHEAEAWGAALAIASFDAMLTWLRRPRRIALVAASGFAMASVLSRASVGFGPIAALGLLAIAVAFPRVRNVAGASFDLARRRAVGVAVAAALPAICYSYVNYAKFGNFFVFPTDRQQMSQVNPGRKFFLAQSGGSYFSLRFIPTTLMQYLRPDALRLGTLMPFIDFPHSPRVIGGVVFDALEPTSSVPSSMPLLFVLACVGIVVVFRHRRTASDGSRIDSGNDALRVLRLPMLGAAVGAVSVLPFGYIAQRYLSDFLPLLVLAAPVGLQLVLRWTEQRDAGQRDGARRDRTTRVVWGGLGVFLAASLCINVALAVSYHYTSDWVPQEVSAPFVAAQYRLHSHVPGGAAPDVVRGDHLPYPPLARGTVFVVGDCAGVYWSPGDVRELAWGAWQGVARSRAAGEYRLHIKFKRTPSTVYEPVVVRGRAGRVQAIAVIVRPDNTAQFVFESQGHDDLPRSATLDGYFPGQIVHFVPGRTYSATAIIDPYNGHVTVLWGHRVVFRFVQFELTPQQASSYVFPTNDVTIGTNTVQPSMEPRFSGTITEDPAPRPSLCNALGVH